MNKLKAKIGIYGGSFNPIHLGHLALANYLCEFSIVDEVWFMVSPQNPLKNNAELLDNAERLNLVKLAINGYSKFKASDFEFHLPVPSYTINTINALKKSFPEKDFYLIIGADNWISFDKWKESKRLLDENRIFIYPRAGSVVDKTNLPLNVQLLDTPLIEINSTFIRNALASGKDIRYFLHPEVYKEIVLKKLYTQPL